MIMINLTNFIELMGAFVLFFAILQTASHRLDFSIKIYSVQSLFLSITIFVMGFYSGIVDLYISGIFTFAIKVIAIPYFLTKVTKRISIREKITPYISMTNSVLITGAITIFAFFITKGALISNQFIAKKVLPIGIAVILIGAFIMIARKKAIIQVVGFLTLENGIILAATSLTKGLPLVIDLGVFFDVFIGALMAGILVYRIRTTFDSLDTSKMSNLKE
jgi:hydrogenase-4 component E